MDRNKIWAPRRREAARLARADADALVRGHGDEASRMARDFERDVVLPDGTTHQGRTPGALAPLGDGEE